MLKTQIRLYLGHANYKVTLDEDVIWKFRENSDMNVDRIQLSRPINSYDEAVETIEKLEEIYGTMEFGTIIAGTIEI